MKLFDVLQVKMIELMNEHQTPPKNGKLDDEYEQSNFILMMKIENLSQFLDLKTQKDLFY